MIVFKVKWCSVVWTLIFILAAAGCAPDKPAGVVDKELPLQFSVWMKKHAEGLQWRSRPPKKRLTREILQQSFSLSRQFMINNQKPEGNFNYEYDFVQKRMVADDNQVRQAGALWGLALMYRFEQDPQNRKALDRGLEFFIEKSHRDPKDGSLVLAYPGDDRCETGTVSLVALSIIEYLRTEKAGKVNLDDTYREKLLFSLDGYINHLKFMRLENGHFSSSYNLHTGTRTQKFSPYFDGEAMLCLVKAAKYMKRTDLVPMIEASALAMAKYYTMDQWAKDPDSRKTKGFFQWSCMAFWEYQTAGWRNADVLGDYVLSLAWWMIHTHRTLKRTRNTAYAYEGIIQAYRLARARNDQAALSELSYTIDQGLYKLTGWQVGGPLQAQNKFISTHPTDDPLAVGGIMNHTEEAPLRIDVTQHQMHAVILALEHVYQ